MRKSSTAAPAGLGPEGLALWTAMTEGGAITYRPDELETLRQACALADTAARIEAELEGAGLTTTGSQGQTVIHPLVTELRLTRESVARQLARLDVPEDDGDASKRTIRRGSARVRHHGPRSVVA